MGLEEDAGALLDAVTADPLFKYMALDVKARPRGGAAVGAGGGYVAACIAFRNAKELATMAKVAAATASADSGSRWRPLMMRTEVAFSADELRSWAAEAAADAGADDVAKAAEAMAPGATAPAKTYVACVACEGLLLASRVSANASYAAPADGEWGYCIKSGADRAERIPTFHWTGKLRPAPISPYRPVPASIPRPDYADTGYPEEEQASPYQRTPPILNAAQIEGMRAAGRLGREVLDAAHRAVRPGATTDEIDRVVHEACVEAGAYPAPLRYFDFPKSVCTSVNEVICHGIPDKRELKEGDAVNVDVTVIKDGFHGDLNETFVVGKPAPELKKLIRVTHECLHKVRGHASSLPAPAAADVRAAPSAAPSSRPGRPKSALTRSAPRSAPFRASPFASPACHSHTSVTSSRSTRTPRACRWSSLSAATA